MNLLKYFFKTLLKSLDKKWLGVYSVIYCTIWWPCLYFHREQLKDDPVFIVPEVIDDLSAGQVLTTEFIEGIPLDKCVDLDQETRDMVSYR